LSLVCAGRALAVALAGRGVRVTVLDLQTAQGEETVRLVEEEHAKISYKPSHSPSAIFIRCDVANSDELAAAYARHQDVFGRLHICINNAGVFSVKVFYEDDSWRKMIDVNLTAVIDGTSKAIHAMKEQGGLILNVASAAAFVPMDLFPIYCASKAGVANFTRSLAHLGMGIRVNALCPEFVNTPLLDELPPLVKDFLGEHFGFLEMEKVTAAAFSLLDDESVAGECVWVRFNRPTEIWPDEESKRKHQPLLEDGSPLDTDEESKRKHQPLLKDGSPLDPGAL
jgi:NAD(P)-dependent dehydrogenase (short-subunit alcohol dehydrogenase family)